jgi:hypothetical protein
MKRSPYTINAGKTTVRGVPTDRHGNATGSEWDLAQDGGFLGHTIAVLHFYTSEGFDFKKPTEALKKKGFKVVRFENTAPPIQEFRKILSKSSQAWIISDSSSKLSSEHVDELVEFFNSGRGLYIWGDNSPYHADANVLLSRLYDSKMSGNFHGTKNLEECMGGTSPGFFQHLVTTGLNHLYEGITISNVSLSNGLERLVNSSDGNCVTAIYDSEGRRALVDGGFTRLFIQWDDAGTARFVCNAAAWLVNWDRYNQDDNNSNNEEDQQTLRKLLDI